MTPLEIVARIDNTIAGKEAYAEALRTAALKEGVTVSEKQITVFMIDLIKLNIKELNAIKADLLSIKS